MEEGEGLVSRLHVRLVVEGDHVGAGRRAVNFSGFINLRNFRNCKRNHAPL